MIQDDQKKKKNNEQINLHSNDANGEEYDPLGKLIALAGSSRSSNAHGKAPRAPSYSSKGG